MGLQAVAQAALREEDFGDAEAERCAGSEGAGAGGRDGEEAGSGLQDEAEADGFVRGGELIAGLAAEDSGRIDGEGDEGACGEGEGEGDEALLVSRGPEEGEDDEEMLDEDVGEAEADDGMLVVEDDGPGVLLAEVHLI